MSVTAATVARDPDNPLPPPAVQAPSTDQLLVCLARLTRHFGRPRSPEALRADLPDNGGRMTPALFLCAAQQAGLTARVAQSPLDRVPAYALPAVLLMQGGEACILWEKAADGRCRIGLPEEGEALRDTTVQELAASHAGYVIYVLPARTAEAGLAEIRCGGGQGHWFWSALAQDWWSYAQVVLAAVMINAIALASPLFIMNVYDRVVPNRALESLWVLAIGTAVAYGFDFVLKTLRGHFIDVSGRKVDILLANRLFDQLLNTRMAARPASAGAFANTLRELESLRDFFTSASLTTLVDLPFVFFFIAVFWYLAGPIAFIPLLAVPVVFLLGVALHWPLSRAVNEAFAEGHQRHGVLVETLGGLETIKSVAGEGKMRQRWMKYVVLSAHSGHRSRFLSQIMINLTALTTQLVYIAIVVYGVHLISRGDITQGALVACVILSGRTMAPLAQLAGLLTRLHHAVSSYATLDRIMANPVERPPDKQFLHRPSLTGAIRFRNVSFAYPDSQIPALEQVDFAIRPGEKVAFIGRTGSGKTTIEKLLLAFYEPAQGAVLVDDTDIRQIDPVDLRRAMACVPQDVRLFQGTLRDNITLGMPRAADREVLQAARIAGVDDFVRSHPMGYDLPVGEGGVGLSGGQRQAVAIARALLRKAPILILDEPTSAMDNRSEELFKTRLREVVSDKTFLLISHRASLLDLVDRIIVLDQGKVVADGPKASVLKALAAGKIQVA